MRTISHFINGQSVTRAGAVTSPVYDPGTGEVQARLEHGDAAILAEAVAVAKAAQPAWAAINPLRRARVLFKFKSLLEEHMQDGQAKDDEPHHRGQRFPEQWHLERNRRWGRHLEYR